MEKENMLVLWFDQIGIEDVRYVGGKNASLGEMYRLLTPRGISIPNGFAVTARAYRLFLERSGIIEQIRGILSDLNTHNVNQLQEKGHRIRELIRHAEMPPEVKEAILEGYYHLCLQCGENTDVAVRSSATAEDLPDAS
ncbi:phosphoenolpyruvate synthase, partial [Candidatus Woesearchaeota archaeon CG10_big_fil_rev_8_21_14_0_10_47_5]